MLFVALHRQAEQLTSMEERKSNQKVGSNLVDRFLNTLDSRILVNPRIEFKPQQSFTKVVTGLSRDALYTTKLSFQLSKFQPRHTRLFATFGSFGRCARMLYGNVLLSLANCVFDTATQRRMPRNKTGACSVVNVLL